MELILPNRWLHIMAVALWLGGQLFLVLVLLPAIRGAMKPEDMAGVVSRVGKRFSRITWLALFPIILITGVINALHRMPSLELLLSTPYGKTLLLKLFIFLGIIAASAVHDFLWGPRAVGLAKSGKIATPEYNAVQKRVLWVPRFTLSLGIILTLLGVALWGWGRIF